MEARENENKGLIKRIRDLASQGYLALIDEIIQKSQAILDDKRQRGEIPSNIRRQFVQDLLDHQQCICGRPFALHDEAYERLKRLLTASLSSALEDDVLTTSGSLHTLLDRKNQVQSDIDQAMKEKVRLQQTIDTLYAKQDDIKRQMGSSKQTEVSNLAKQREEYQSDIYQYRDEQTRVDMELEETRKLIASLEKQISQARTVERREQLLGRKIELAQQSSDAIAEMFEVFVEEKRQHIESRTREIFHTLAWKSEHFSDVRLTPDYQLEIIDRYGLPARPELSAGERQVLSLSFITAMAQVAEREAPLVMDTPFGRLSSAHRESITANVPNLANQLILFVTDEELRDQALANLRPRIGTEYVLHFNLHTSCTTIEEVKQ
ncbi:MAG: hypothetical protein HC837_15060 [Chloroflexaceae bacterium]|nr:hypothetical protein [Chloroflexaceae bacterium]